MLPDLEIIRGSRVVGRVEVKAHGRAFMSVARLLPHGDLRPYETLALNLSDLKRYICTIWRSQTLPTSIN